MMTTVRMDVGEIGKELRSIGVFTILIFMIGEK